MSLQPQTQKPGSALEEYSANYGQKLRSMLQGVSSAFSGVRPIDTNNMSAGAPDPRTSMLEPPPPDGGMPQAPGGRGPYIPPEDPTVPMEPGGTADPGGGQDMGGPMSSELGGDPEQPPTSALEGGQKKGFGFRDAWKEAPEAAKKRELNKLEESLKRGNQTIDDAYDDLERQMGTAPEKKKKLSREEKGMLLMEFGLNVLANNKRGFGAIGQAGGKALQSYNEMSQGPYKDYQATQGAIAGARAGSKVKLAEQSALESVKTPKEVGSRLPGRFTGDDGFVYFYDEEGRAKKALDDDGKPIKAQVDENGPGGSSGRTFESDAKYNRYMEIYGVDRDTGQPLTGTALQKVKQDALDFANDRGNQIDDLELDLQAERSADEFMKAHAELYEGMTSEQINAERDKLADKRRSRLKRPVRSRLEDRPEPQRGRGGGGKRRFASEADAKAAFQRGDIQVGDTIIVNGVEGPVE